MEKVFIKNRDNKKIAVVVEKPDNAKGLVFIMHGLSGYKDQDHIRSFAKTFFEDNYTVITFDARNTVGESEGSMEEASTTSYYQDLEDVINWAKNQDFYAEPFILCGHSLGGICVALYAEKYPAEVKALAPLATVVSGDLSEGKYGKESLEQWKKTGWKEKMSRSKPGTLIRISYSEFLDRKKYDLLKNVQNLTMPVLLIVGDQDISTPLEHQQILFDQLPGKKELHIIRGAEHTFRDQIHLDEISSIINNWLKKIG